MLYRSDVPASSKWPVDPRNGGHLTLEKVTYETPKCIQMGHLDVLRWGSKSNGIIIHVWHYMFSNKSWSSRPFLFAMGFGDGDLAHTHTLNTHTVIHRWLLIHPPKTNILLIEEILHEFYTCLVVEDLFHQQQNLSLVQMIFLFQGCIMYSQGSCAVNLPGRIRWPEGMNPQARYVPPW